VAVRFRYYIPEIALQRHPDRQYVDWRKGDLLVVTPGDVTDYGRVREDIQKDCQASGVVSVFYDQRSARETAQILAGQGIDMVPLLQGFQLTEAIKRMLALISEGTLCHEHEQDPILTWMASNLVLREGSKGERRVDKEKAPDKIDGIAALVMGIEGALVRREREPEKTYQVMVLGGRKR
jgi:phage terminase large subunit-like protein